jgi:hypothetical protein
MNRCFARERLFESSSSLCQNHRARVGELRDLLVGVAWLVLIACSDCASYWPVILPAHIHPSLILRVISSHGLGAPLHSLATVQSVETSRSGDWACIVEYPDRRPPRQGTRLYRSHLWASDLNRFEIVTGHIKSPPGERKGKKNRFGPLATRLQLELPFDI